MPTQATRARPDEGALIIRTITFRQSTFTALKDFIQGHERRHGERLTNAAAVDRLIRERLGIRA